MGRGKGKQKSEDGRRKAVCSRQEEVKRSKLKATPIGETTFLSGTGD